MLKGNRDNETWGKETKRWNRLERRREGKGKREARKEREAREEREARKEREEREEREARKEREARELLRKRGLDFEDKISRMYGTLLYAKKLDNLEGKDKVLEIYTLPKLTQEKIEEFLTWLNSNEPS